MILTPCTLNSKSITDFFNKKHYRFIGVLVSNIMSFFSENKFLIIHTAFHILFLLLSSFLRHVDIQQYKFQQRVKAYPLELNRNLLLRIRSFWAAMCDVHQKEEVVVTRTPPLLVPCDRGSCSKTNWGYNKPAWPFSTQSSFKAR